MKDFIQGKIPLAKFLVNQKGKGCCIAPQIISPFPRKLSQSWWSRPSGLFLEAALQRALTITGDAENDPIGNGQTHLFHQ